MSGVHSDFASVAPSNDGKDCDHAKEAAQGSRCVPAAGEIEGVACEGAQNQSSQRDDIEDANSLALFFKMKADLYFLPGTGTQGIVCANHHVIGAKGIAKAPMGTALTRRTLGDFDLGHLSGTGVQDLTGFCG